MLADRPIEPIGLGRKMSAAWMAFLLHEHEFAWRFAWLIKYEPGIAVERLVDELLVRDRAPDRLGGADPLPASQPLQRRSDLRDRFTERRAPVAVAERLPVPGATSVP